MANVINESGMDFIADNAFEIENSKIYKELGEGIKSVEFVRGIDDMLLFVEAKTTFPNSLFVIYLDNTREDAYCLNNRFVTGS